jgi:UDP-2,3-diacylglucosamine hydrolase
LVINGDLFEFWFEWRTVIPRSSFRVLAALADLREAGTDVLMIAGNHDCWGGDVLRRDVGLDYHVGPWEGPIADWRSRIEHGDGLRPREDRRYRMLRRVLRNPVAIRAFRWLHPDFGTRIATHSSHASRSYGARDQGRGLARIASEQLTSRPDLELLLYGHSHFATLVRTPNGGVYANAGSWLDAPTYLRLTSERIELRQWNGSAEGLYLDALDRIAEKALT